MKNFSSILLFACLVSAIPAGAVTLPDSCGNEQARFDVKTRKDAPALAPAEDGKARIVLMESENLRVTPFTQATVRFGMDGAWVGADYGTSYFVLTVDPGVHHVCANWQSSLGRFKKESDALSFTAEAGKTYYFSAAITAESENVVDFALAQLNDDQGKYRIKFARLSSSKSK